MEKLQKPYKEISPITTVNRIRNILNEIGIFVSEEHKQDGEYHTCRLEIANRNLKKFKIGTNGKGTSIEYCYASAYAEFMERLQNNILLKKSYYFSKHFDIKSSFIKLLIKNKLRLDFLFDPAEKVLDMNEVIDTNERVFNTVLKLPSKRDLKTFLIDKLGYTNVICVPFYNKTDNKVSYLPLELLFLGSGSNGMCAGNTPEEALIQGICEILERHAIREIHKNRLTPPTIPLEYFKEYPIYNSILKLKEQGLKIFIKDFSLGKSLPVIAVIVVNEAKNTYNVKVGSDPWPITALERCLTELHQSFSGIRLINRNGAGDFIEDRYKTIDRTEAEHINLKNIFTNASGQWPNTIFEDNYSYKFQGLNFNLGKSNKLDFRFLTNLIENLGFHLYIRDVSYLGLNSYYVVIPGLSEQKTCISDYTIFYDLYYQLKNINNVTSLTKEELVAMVTTLEKSYIALKEGHINFKDELLFNTDEDALDLDVDVFLSMAYYKLNNSSKAHHYLNSYLKDKDRATYIYFFACKDYLELANQKKTKIEIQSFLSKIYSEELSEEVIEDMQEPEKIFKAYNLNSYFHCEKCNVDQFDYYPVASFLKKMEAMQFSSSIDQRQLSQLFN